MSLETRCENHRIKLLVSGRFQVPEEFIYSIRFVLKDVLLVFFIINKQLLRFNFSQTSGLLNQNSFDLFSLNDSWLPTKLWKRYVINHTGKKVITKYLRKNVTN